MRKYCLLLLASAPILLAGPAAAQTEVGASASITVGEVLYIEVTNTTVGFASPTATDFNAGSIESATQSVISHRGNVTHDVTVQADAATMTGENGSGATDDVDADKPTTDLELSLNGTDWTGLASSTGTADVLHDAAARGVHDSDETVSYRMLLDYATDTPGDYSLAFTYTVVAD